MGTSINTSLITSQRPRFGPVDSKRRSRFRYCVLQYLPIVGYLAFYCYLLYQECLSFSLASPWTLSGPPNDTFSRIAIFRLGPQTQQMRGAYMEVSKQYVEEHGNVRLRVLVGDRTTSGLHFANLLALNHHNYNYRRIEIY